MSTREEVLASLRMAGPAGVGGEELAAQLNVSRVAISKHVAALRQLGYEIAASPASGYRLDRSPDVALPYEVRPLLCDPLWSRIEGGPVTGSTNDDALVLARQGAPEGTVVIAAQQREGRGRFGREWNSPLGGAYLSAILRPGVAPSQAGPLSLVIGIGIARGLERLGVDAGIKWPNDVWIGSSKVAGILVEMSAQGEYIDWVVAGFGLNARRHEGSNPDVVFISDSVDVRVPVAAAAALDGVAEAYRDWQAEGFVAMRSEFLRRSVLEGKHVVVSDLTGAVRAQGTASGVDDEGRLLVRFDGQTIAVASGEVTLRQ